MLFKVEYRVEETEGAVTISPFHVDDAMRIIREKDTIQVDNGLCCLMDGVFIQTLAHMPEGHSFYGLSVFSEREDSLRQVVESLNLPYGHVESCLNKRESDNRDYVNAVINHFST